MSIKVARNALPRLHALQVVIVAALLVPLATFGLAAWLAWQTTFEAAERALGRSADAVGEYALRILDTHRLAAAQVDDRLRGLSDIEIRAREGEVHATLAALFPAFPMVRTTVLLAADGAILAAGTVYPIPGSAHAGHREWVRALAEPATPEPYLSRVVLGVLDNLPFFGVTIRRTGTTNPVPPGATEGLINVAIDPAAVARGLDALLGGGTESVLALVRADGEYLARMPAFPAPRPPVPATSPFHAIVASGVERGVYRSAIADGGAAALIAIRRIPSWSAYAAVARPIADIRAEWLATVRLQLAWGTPATLALLGAAAIALRSRRAAAAAEAARHAEATRRAAAEAARSAEARFRGVFESRAIGMAIYDIASDRSVEVNDRLLEMTGTTRADFEARRWDARDATAPESRAAHAAAMAEARARGWWDPFEKEYLRPDGSRLPVRLVSAPLPREPGRVVAMVIDISDQREAEHRRDILTQEVNHRAKNALATAQAFLRLTQAETVEEYRAVVGGRIAALALALGTLAHTGWTGADLATVVRDELEPFATDGVRSDLLRVHGPDVTLTANAVQPLILSLHELATNAVKYGALSEPDGSLDVTWRIDPDTNAVTITWTEHDGPPVAGIPETNGFGTRLLLAAIERQLGGRVSIRWEPTGLVCEIALRPESCLVGATAD